jgi:uncharacterized protein YciI
MLTVVFHHHYFSTHDNGLRIYDSNDSYLREHPSMYTWVAEFASLEDARQFVNSQPCKVEND